MDSLSHFSFYTDLGIAKRFLSCLQSDIIELHDGFIQRLKPNNEMFRQRQACLNQNLAQLSEFADQLEYLCFNTVDLMLLDQQILPWLEHYYQSALAECEMFIQHKLLWPVRKRVVFKHQLNQIQEKFLQQQRLLSDAQINIKLALKKRLQYRQKKSTSCALQWSDESYWDDPLATLMPAEVKNIKPVSIRQWAVWESGSTALNRGFYDGVIFVPACTNTISDTCVDEAALTTDEKQPVSETAAKKLSFWKRALQAAGKWFLKELLPISSCAVVSSLFLMVAFGPTLVLTISFIAGGVGVFIGWIRPAFLAFKRWILADPVQLSHYYLFNQDYLKKAVHDFTNQQLGKVALDSADQDELYLTSSTYQLLNEMHEKVYKACKKRRPEHWFWPSQAHYLFRQKTCQSLMMQRQQLKTDFNQHQEAMVEAVESKFKGSVVKQRGNQLALNVNPRILQIWQETAALLNRPVTITMDSWLENFFRMYLLTSLEPIKKPKLGLPTYRIKPAILEALSLQYELLRNFLTIPTEKPALALTNTANPLEDGMLVPRKEASVSLRRGFSQYCSQTFDGEFWKIPFLTEAKRGELQFQLESLLNKLNLPLTIFETNPPKKGQLDWVNAYFPQQFQFNTCGQYVQILNHAWQIWLVLNKGTESLTLDQYSEKQQLIEQALEDWLCSLTEADCLEPSWIQVLRLERFQLDCTAEQYQTDTAYQKHHEIWWCLVRNWLSYHFNFPDSPIDENEIQIVNQYYQITKKIQVEKAETWFQSKSDSIRWDDCESLIQALSIPLLTYYFNQKKGDIKQHAPRTKTRRKFFGWF